MNVKVGLVSLGFVKFRVDIAQSYLDAAEALLRSQQDVEVSAVPKVVTDEREVAQAVDVFGRDAPDMIIIQCGTFSMGRTIVALAEAIPTTPLFLWGFREPETPGIPALPLNSLCGLNMSASFLYKLRRRFSTLYASVDEDEARATIRRWITAIRLRKGLRRARFCSIGERAPGFYRAGVDELRFARTIGPEIIYHSVGEVVEAARRYTDDEVAEEVTRIYGEVDLVEATREAVERSARVYRAVRAFGDRNDVAAFAIRCWPEFQTLYRVAVCGVVSRLNNEGVVVSCEGDIPALATMVIHRSVSDRPPFLADLVDISPKGVVKAWHCGPAARCLADPEARTRYIEHPTIKEGIGMAADFPLADGRVTMAKLSEDEGRYKLLIAPGTAVRPDRELAGNHVDIVFDCGAPKLLEAIFSHGIEHHYSIAYGDDTATLLEYCKWSDIEPILLAGPDDASRSLSLLQGAIHG